jgi:hypothetical protein
MPSSRTTRKGVGESTTRRAEDVTAEDGKEPGRYDSGTQGESGRPYGGSAARATTGVDPQGTHRRLITPNVKRAG